jgi:hypothetical protein
MKSRRMHSLLYNIELTVCSIRGLENWPPLKGPGKRVKKIYIKIDEHQPDGAKADPNKFSDI